MPVRKLKQNELIGSDPYIYKPVPTFSTHLLIPPSPNSVQTCISANKMLSVALLMDTIIRPSVLLAGNFLSISTVELLYAIANSPVNSLIDVSVRQSSGAEG